LSLVSPVSETSVFLSEHIPTPPKENRSTDPPPSYISTPMPNVERTDSEEKREEPSGATLSVEEWIELMNKHDPLEQYAKKRKKEKRKKGRQERKEEKDESNDE